MKTIVEANSLIKKVWGTPKPKETEYRLIRYHLRTDCDKGELLHNIVTGEMVLLDQRDSKLLRRLPAKLSEDMSELIAHHFLVPTCFDEKKSVYQLRGIISRLKKTENITEYTILPTSDCNARCFYCYESGYPHVSMTKETADRVIDYIAKHCGEKKRVHLQWFGGEPLLGEKRIDQICNGLKQRGIEYKSSMISNTYLFTEEMALKAKELWKLEHIQSTLDGTEEIYNCSKSYVNIKDNAYKRVLGNIGYLLDQGIRVSVRLNLGQHNADDLWTLIDELAELYSGRSGFSIYAGILFNDLGFMPVHYNEQIRLELEQVRLSLEEYIKEKKCKQKSVSLPHLKMGRCMADNDNAILINPQGEFGHCEHYIFEKFSGDILSGRDQKGIAYWKELKEWPKCDTCILFPKCVLLQHCGNKNECLDITIEDEIKSYQRHMIDKISGTENI